MRPSLIYFGALLGLAASASLHAKEGIKFSGFGSLGALTTNTEELGYGRDTADTQATREGDINLNSLSLIGLQLNYHASNKLEFIGQTILRDHPEQNADNILRIASLNYELSPDWQLRLGRLTQRTYLLSDSRTIGYANLWTMPVQEFYSLLVYNYIDGIDTTYSMPLGQGYLHTSASYGQTTIYINEGQLGSSSFDLKQAMNINFEYEINNWLARFSWAQATADSNLESADLFRENLTATAQLLMWEQGQDAAELLDMTDKKFQFFSAALRYNDGSIRMQSELGRLQSDTEIIPSISSAYISLGKAINQFTPYILIAYTKSDDKSAPALTPPVQSPELLQLIAGTTSFIESGFNQQSVGIGIRWDIGFKYTVKFEWDHKWISDNGYSLWEPEENMPYPDGDQQADVLSVRFDFIF